jgi:ribosomal protein S6--L-glutamate ligase
VIVAGDYWEAYTRENDHNFRSNLTLGGRSKPYALNSIERALCNTIMERGKFPYAHVDLLITSDGTPYLSEIALNGGLKGAKIDREKLDAKKKEILEISADQCLTKGNAPLAG